MIPARLRFHGQYLHNQSSKLRFTIDVPWPGLQCIVCLANSDLTVEHLIPEALGGRLTSRLLCRACNSRIGHQAEGQAKADPTIRSLNLSTTVGIALYELARPRVMLVP